MTTDQKEIITTLAFMYYSSGDVKDIWEGEDGEIPEDYDFQKSPYIIGRFARAFNLHSEKEIVMKLDALLELYSEPSNFTLKTDI